jgi:hypothetical protein
MKMKKLNYLFFLLFFCISFAQNVQFVNKQNIPVEGVVLIDNHGKMVGSTDIGGNVPQQNLDKSDFVILSHPSLEQDTIYIKDIKNNRVIVNPIREQKITEVAIKNSDKEYLTITGYFNTYITNNGEFNGFVDGIMETVIDRKTNKVKDNIIKEYRSFILEKKEETTKEVSSMVFEMNKTPKLNSLTNAISKEGKFKLTNSINNEIIAQYKKSLFTEKELKLFGYRLFNENLLESFVFSDNKIQPKNLVFYKCEISMDVKHKSEEKYNRLNIFTNFYPNEISFKNKNELEKGVKFDREKSQVKTKYWEDENNAGIYKILAAQFKENFKQQ